ncbi:glutamate decarboxylase [Paraphaeosphaeria minitans]|uniref:Glutamate decarboxylase n=1 Tax=Paraphaeosphaeria minitans TaxID=565426 RepID=A0A9P6GGF3_9PLEO|nr:glutamate decarboxylase [Paraphaeosphaeria minitans]
MAETANELKRILSKITPGDVCRSDVLKLAFVEFWERGTELQHPALLRARSAPPEPIAKPEHTSAAPEAEQTPEQSPAVSEPEQTLEPSSAVSEPEQISERLPAALEPQQTLERSPTASEPAQTSERAYIQLTKTRMGFAQKLVKKKILPKADYSKLWAYNDTINDRLGQLRDVLLNSSEGYKHRIKLLFLGHAVESYIPTIKLTAGKNAKTLGLEAISKSCNVNHKKVKMTYDRTKNYLLLAKNCGLGAILTTASITEIERISSRDLGNIFLYLAHNHEEVLGAFESMSTIAAELIVRGLVNYGWTFHQLAQSKSDIMELVCCHVERKALEKGMIRYRAVKGTCELSSDLRSKKKALKSMSDENRKRARIQSPPLETRTQIVSTFASSQDHSLARGPGVPSGCPSLAQLELATHRVHDALAINGTVLGKRNRAQMQAQAREKGAVERGCITPDTTPERVEGGSYLVESEISERSQINDDIGPEWDMPHSTTSTTTNLQQDGSAQLSFNAFATPSQLPPRIAITHPLNCPAVDAPSDCPSSAGAELHDEQADCRADLLCGNHGSIHFGGPSSVGEQIRDGENLHTEESRNENSSEIGTALQVALSEGYISQVSGDSVLHVEVGSSQEAELMEATESEERPTSVYINSLFGNDPNMEQWETFYLD